MLSLRQSLAQIGKHPPLKVPSAFQTCPKSLREAIQIMDSPRSREAAFNHRCVYSFTEENAQGLAYAYDTIWYLSSQNHILKVSIEGADLYSPSQVRRVLQAHRDELVAAAGLDPGDYDHIGDLSYSGGWNGLLFAPIRRRDNAHVLLLCMNMDLVLAGYAYLPKGTSDAWCAINPWNGLLYAGSQSSTNRFHAFEVSAFFEILGQPEQYGRLVELLPSPGKELWLSQADGSSDWSANIQGASISPDGHLYVTRWINEYTNYLRAYDVLTGVRLWEQEYDFEGYKDEIEGISIHPSGVVYIAVCDNDWPSTDEFEIHAFQSHDL